MEIALMSNGLSLAIENTSTSTKDLEYQLTPGEHVHGIDGF